jgi:two-component system LytT family response regulator
MTSVAPIRVLIVDDEALACRRLRRLLRGVSGLEIAGVCTNGPEAVSAINKLQPDLLLLDVQMPGMDGFGVLKALKTDKLPYVIFVTAFDQYAIQAFDVHALDYLLKPFDRERFEEALDRAKNQIRREKEGVDEGLLALLQEIRPQSQPLERVVIKSNGRVFFLKTEQIDWIEAQGKYVLIHAGKGSHLVREGMNILETKLDPKKFVRIHKSSIVNLDRIHQLHPWFHGDYKVLLYNGTELTLSRRFRQNLNDLLGRQL